MLRYPGGKTKIKKTILSKLIKIYDNDNDINEYREPFFGGGSIGLEFIKESPNIKNFWLNDKDFGIYALWKSVLSNPTELKFLVREFVPTVGKFYEFKNDLLFGEKSDDIVNIGFKKLAIHQISYSGLGTKSGSPQGGKSQKSKYKIDCRWSPNHICKNIDNINNLFCSRNIKITNLDFSEILDGGEALIYLDPPYYEKGGELYQYSFNFWDHLKLAESLKLTKNKWLLSYDDCSEIRKLYSWAQTEEINLNYTINSSRNKNELLINNVF